MLNRKPMTVIITNAAEGGTSGSICHSAVMEDNGKISTHEEINLLRCVYF
jgi:hypothetical protein